MLARLSQFGILAAMVVIAVSLGTAPSPAAKGGGKGGGGGSENNFNVAVVAGDFLPVGGTSAPLFAPTDDKSSCIADTPGSSLNYTFFFPNPPIGVPNCAAVDMDGPYELTDDIQISTVASQGVLSTVTLLGQDFSGEDGTLHESEAIALTPEVIPSGGGFTIHVHRDNVPVWSLTKHSQKRIAIIGHVAIGDIVYSSQ